MKKRTKINFPKVKLAALAQSDRLTYWLLPLGKRQGQEWVTLNPTRDDTKIGSFKVNLVTGRWADFATSDSGGDLISLVAYILGISQSAAAIRIENFLGEYK